MSDDKTTLRGSMKVGFAAAAALALAGCVSITKNDVAEIVPGADDFRSRVESIEPGDSREMVLQKLQLSADQFASLSATMDDSAAYSYVFGDQNPVRGTRLDEYNRLDGVTIMYQNIREDTRYNLMNTRTRTTGDNLSTVIIFRDGAVVNDPVVAETQINQRNNDSHLRRINPLDFVPGM